MALKLRCSGSYAEMLSRYSEVDFFGIDRGRDHCDDVPTIVTLVRYLISSDYRQINLTDKKILRAVALGPISWTDPLEHHIGAR